MKLVSFSATAAMLLLALGPASAALAAPFALQQVFRHPAPDSYDGFGWSVALVDGNVLVGAYSSAEAYTGSAFLFDPPTGELLRTLTSPAPVANDYFGWTLAAVGNKILIGAYGDDTGADSAGAAYLFDQTGALLQSYFNPTPAADDRFGFSVAALGENVLIGAPRDDTGAADAGAAYLFDGATGDLLQTFANPTPDAGDQFGWSVARVGDKALIGSYASGSAYLFDSLTGDLLHTLQGSVGFGFSVAGVGQNALIGSPWEGVVRLFDASSAELLLTLPKPVPGAERFGFFVTSAETNILVGVPWDDTAGLDAGAVFLFDGCTGELLQAIADPEPIIPEPPYGGRHWFGRSASATNTSILVGAWGGNFCSAGRYRAAYLFVPATPGDANLDGAITLSDLALLAHNWQGVCMNWARGDFNGDGTVNLLDLTILAGNWQAGAAQVVCEPAGLFLLGLGGLALAAFLKKGE